VEVTGWELSIMSPKSLPETILPPGAVSARRESRDKVGDG